MNFKVFIGGKKQNMEFLYYGIFIIRHLIDTHY